jgi:hypothetical protein
MHHRFRYRGCCAQHAYKTRLTAATACLLGGSIEQSFRPYSDALSTREYVDGDVAEHYLERLRDVIDTYDGNGEGTRQHLTIVGTFWLA